VQRAVVGDVLARGGDAGRARAHSDSTADRAPHLVPCHTHVEAASQRRFACAGSGSSIRVAVHASATQRGLAPHSLWGRAAGESSPVRRPSVSSPPSKPRARDTRGFAGKTLGEVLDRDHGCGPIRGLGHSGGPARPVPRAPFTTNSAGPSLAEAPLRRRNDCDERAQAGVRCRHVCGRSLARMMWRAVRERPWRDLRVPFAGGWRHRSRPPDRISTEAPRF
jgi:hypothetical protein